MKSLSFKQAENQTDFENIHLLAKEIWQEHYANILSQSQIQYMIQNFQSVQAIAKQTQENYEYFKIIRNEELAGYFAIIQKNDPYISKNVKGIFLSKLYIQKNHRNQGIAKAVMHHLKELVKTLQIDYIWLSVNKQNINSLKAYEKLGFKVYREDKIPIGEGYIMDDYYMKLDINFIKD
ncbi:hypothetical protein BKH41_00650 [Helicobacter sp. 12S02232-10]|uniref:GNAT family N-acetyltransferase n=1 Tax=Helicobacter sp. 12S02232-10 TaxID=1476197 RepID=UPI000BA59985|nr:GNAT family N-acetyltransferase [Helicobacter sp. 12S02232-10]PAF49844.1 hypothetical protein BKH41_00650 [Helicobacter sp. 12S02232-10]